MQPRSGQFHEAVDVVRQGLQAVVRDVEVRERCEPGKAWGQHGEEVPREAQPLQREQLSQGVRQLLQAVRLEVKFNQVFHIPDAVGKDYQEIASETERHKRREESDARRQVPESMPAEIEVFQRSEFTEALR
mmetsp:Transcript_5171/g.11983  ORF Transcript_5171/g.11983 Transcript_5171/m.11983 type:complete len:132 (-) Transcript_5171:378-773(-)